MSHGVRPEFNYVICVVHLIEHTSFFVVVVVAKVVVVVVVVLFAVAIVCCSRFCTSSDEVNFVFFLKSKIESEVKMFERERETENDESVRNLSKTKGRPTSMLQNIFLCYI